VVNKTAKNKKAAGFVSAAFAEIWEENRLLHSRPRTSNTAPRAQNAAARGFQGEQGNFEIHDFILPAYCAVRQAPA
jgi:hypothetical protein